MKKYQSLPVYASMLLALVGSFNPAQVRAEQALEGYVMRSPQDGLYSDGLYLPVNTNQGRRLVYCDEKSTIPPMGLTELSHYIVKGDKVRINFAGDSGDKLINSCDITVIDDLVN